MTTAEARFNNSLPRPRKPEGSLGWTAQDVHLDSHAAPQLWAAPSHLYGDLAADRPAWWRWAYLGLWQSSSHLQMISPTLARWRWAYLGSAMLKPEKSLCARLRLSEVFPTSALWNATNVGLMDNALGFSHPSQSGSAKPKTVCQCWSRRWLDYKVIPNLTSRLKIRQREQGYSDLRTRCTWAKVCSHGYLRDQDVWLDVVSARFHRLLLLL